MPTELEDKNFLINKQKLNLHAEVYHKIAINDYFLLDPSRVPNFLK